MLIPPALPAHQLLAAIGLAVKPCKEALRTVGGLCCHDSWLGAISNIGIGLFNLKTRSAEGRAMSARARTHQGMVLSPGAPLFRKP
jgi:hypothetical protein